MSVDQSRHGVTRDDVEADDGGNADMHAPMYEPRAVIQNDGKRKRAAE
jgi:hypothetical protein